MKRQIFLLIILTTLLPLTPQSGAQTSSPEPLLRDIYRELIEINTVTTSGDTAKAAQAMADRLLMAGFPAADVQAFTPAPRKGNLVARLRGTGARRPILLLAHLDVVDAKREDWTTDPFRFVEKDGFFYGRGTSDDKAMAAIFVANMIRYKQEGLRPDRDIILALETDEEGADENMVGIQWLIKNHRDLIDAEFVINEGGAAVSKNGKPYMNTIQTSEKIYVDYHFSVTDAGGHSSLPSNESNAIYHLAAALDRLAKFQFPVRLNETTRNFFERMASLEQGQLAADMRAVTRTTPDPAAVKRLSALPVYNAQLRTTCVATMLSGGHAPNALPQLARATVNCRVLPTESVDEVKKTLTRVAADERVIITEDGAHTLSPPSPLTSELMRTIETTTAQFWPGIPVVPDMSTGATDGAFLRNAGIPTYGHSGLMRDILENRAHGKDERMGVKEFFTGAEYLYRLVKALSKPEL
jgi:acetylornithine deacetylase/succinyl-diaminopimelate desuccinylase-like protein